MLETGLKNAQICLAILTVSFPITDVGVLMMMPLYFLFFQVCSKLFTGPTVKGSLDPNHFTYEINVGKRWIRHRRILKLNFLFDSQSIEDGFILTASHSLSDPTLSDIHLMNKMAWV